MTLPRSDEMAEPWGSEACGPPRGDLGPRGRYFRGNRADKRRTGARKLLRESALRGHVGLMIRCPRRATSAGLSPNETGRRGMAYCPSRSEGMRGSTPRSPLTHRT